MYVLALHTILRVMQGLRYDVQQLTKQQERLSAQLQQSVGSGHFGGGDSVCLASEFDSDLPIETEDNLTQFEEKMEDSSKFQSLVGGAYYRIRTPSI
jgi:hypothetical protein